MFRNAVRKRLRGNRLRRIPVKPTCLRRAASSMETGGGWLLSSGRIVDFNTPALRGQDSQALVLGHRCVWGGHCTLMDWPRVFGVLPLWLTGGSVIWSSQGSQLDKGSLCRDRMNLALQNGPQHCTNRAMPLVLWDPE